MEFKADYTLLFFLFLALKLTGYIAWSWFYVTMPLWLPLGIVLVCCLVLLLVKLISNC